MAGSYGGNLSDFKGEQRPVNSVSWDDRQKFIKKLNKHLKGSSVCQRKLNGNMPVVAGVRTAFSLGDNISPEQANYDGEFPYDNGKIEKDQGRTIEVKSLLCNN